MSSQQHLLFVSLQYVSHDNGQSDEPQIPNISSIVPKRNILILTNKSDNGKDNWQPSLKKFARKISIN